MSRPLLRHRLALAAIAALAAAVLLGATLWWRLGPRAPLAAHEALAAYEPRELVSGGDQPPAPRVAPQLEQLERAGLDGRGCLCRARTARAH